jgi:predicted site-specific integrase-resolvase
MKLSDYARKVGVSYRTAWRWYRNGHLTGYQIEVIIVELRNGEEGDHPPQA